MVSLAPTLRRGNELNESNPACFCHDAGKSVKKLTAHFFAKPNPLIQRFFVFGRCFAVNQAQPNRWSRFMNSFNQFHAPRSIRVALPVYRPSDSPLYTDLSVAMETARQMRDLISQWLLPSQATGRSRSTQR